MKTSPSLNPNSLEWRIAFDLGYWRGIRIADRSRYPAASEMHTGPRFRAECEYAREAVKRMSRARRRAFGAQIRSTLQRTLQWKGHSSAAVGAAAVAA